MDIYLKSTDVKKHPFQRSLLQEALWHLLCTKIRPRNGMFLANANEVWFDTTTDQFHIIWFDQRGLGQVCCYDMSGFTCSYFLNKGESGSFGGPGAETVAPTK